MEIDLNFLGMLYSLYGPGYYTENKNIAMQKHTLSIFLQAETSNMLSKGISAMLVWCL